MIFQGRELRIGDNLVSKRHGKITVESMQRKFFTATAPREGILCAWDYEGRYCYGDDLIIDARWPDASPEQAPSPSQALHDRMIDFMDSCKPLSPDIQQKAEYRRIWIEVAMRLVAVPAPMRVDMAYGSKCNEFSIAEAFDTADAFLAELKKRDGSNNGAD